MNKKMNFVKIQRWILMFSLLQIFTACKDEDNPEHNKSVVGKWQKYQVLDEDGNFSEGDLDEFWILNTDGSFKNEDGGNITTIGYYTADGSQLNIYSHSIDDPDEEENYSGSYVIDNNYMTYSFTEMRDGEKSTIRFKRM